MPRNLDNRIEVVTPIYDPAIKEDLKRVVQFGLDDTKQGRIVDGYGTNESNTLADGSVFRSQEELYKLYFEKDSKC